MIEGVMVLSKAMIMIPNPLIAKMSVICCGVLAISTMFVNMPKKTEKLRIVEAVEVVMFISALLAVLGMILGFAFQVPSGRYEYTVNINNNVTVNELLSNYEIKNVNGSTYTIVDKN